MTVGAHSVRPQRTYKFRAEDIRPYRIFCYDGTPGAAFPTIIKEK